MTPSELEAALIRAFQQCEAELCPLSEQQQQIVRRTIGQQLDALTDVAGTVAKELNPLEELTPEERQALLAFVKAEESQSRSWKIRLLNDWIAGRESGAVQFIRDRYGIQWLERVQPFHLAQYDGFGQNEMMRLKVGDRIEVTNGLWEWVQEEGPCEREWFPCTVIQIHAPEATSSKAAVSPDEDNTAMPIEEAVPAKDTSCIVRFDTGDEYEIQGVYDWNRPNWRWLQP